MNTETLDDADWEQCSFCHDAWRVRQYESVARCEAHAATPLGQLRRERDEARAESLRLRAARAQWQERAYDWAGGGEDDG